MKFTIFGKTFEFLTREEQWDKLNGFLHFYLFDRPMAHVAVILCGLILMLFFISLFMKGRGKLYLNRLSFLLYNIVLLLIFIFNRDVGESRVRLSDITLYMEGDIYHESMVLVALLCLIMFIPFGFLLKRAIGKKKRLVFIMVTVLVALGIEILQYTLGRGYFSIYDSLLYLIGALLGSLFAFWQKS